MDKKVVLVVEDNKELREVLKTILETGYGYEVLEATDGATAIGILTGRKPHIDAAILDIVMKGHGGSVRDYLKKMPQYREVPIIYHTGLSKEQFDNRILEGAYYIQKGEGSIKKIGEILKSKI
ncbi:MAG TPA: response regulator [Candidatus Omnitrophica bacterium]|nr:response regulator [Candidatus Omnitrophota bacterium]